MELQSDMKKHRAESARENQDSFETHRGLLSPSTPSLSLPEHSREQSVIAILGDAGRQFALAQTFQELLQSVVDNAAALVRADVVLIGLYTAGSTKLEIAATNRMGAGIGLQFESAEALG